MAPPGVSPETYLQFFKEDIQELQCGYVLHLGALGTVWCHGGLGVATTDMPQGISLPREPKYFHHVHSKSVLMV
jgi:hypothetical protein